MTTKMTALEIRRLNYEELGYYEARANAALSKGDVTAHITWAQKYHALKRLIED